MTPYLRDPFGLKRMFYHPASGAIAPSMRQVLQQSAGLQAQPDPEAILGFFQDQRIPGRTVIRHVLCVPPAHALEKHGSSSKLQVRAIPCIPCPGSLKALLSHSLQQAIDSGKRVALALSGGLDSALLLALIREMGATHIPAYILATEMPDYCERAPAQALAQQLGFETRIATVDSGQFVAALPETVQHVEEPLFNLHPVAKLLLADAMARDGIELAITGDGADQVLRRDQSANYLPLCQALFQARQVTLHAPFLDTGVIAHLLSLEPDPHKQCLRTLAAQLALPQRLTNAPKQSRLAPSMNLNHLLDIQRIHQLSSALNMSLPSLISDRERVLWTTLLLTLEHLNALPSSMSHA